MSRSTPRRLARGVKLVAHAALAAVTVTAVLGVAATAGASTPAKAHAAAAPTSTALHVALTRTIKPNVTIGNTACGSLTVNPSTAVYGGEGATVGVTWDGGPNNPNCNVQGSNCGSTYFGDCNSGYWLVGLWCSTLAASDISGAQGDCDLNNIIVMTDYDSGPNNPSDNHGTSYNRCSTLNTLGSIFGGLPGTLNCITDGDNSNGWSDSWGQGNTSGSASGPIEETGTGTPFNPGTSGVDCPPSAANIAAGAIPNTCAFVVFPVTFQYYCVGGCLPNVSDSNDGIGEDTNDFMATTFQYQYAPSFTSGSSTSVQAGNALSVPITTNASPTATVTASGTLPSGVTFQQEGGGSALISGTPAVGTQGTYNITLTASNGVAPNATQSFQLVVTPRPPPPAITGMSPSAGPTAGGTTVTLTGTTFTGATAVDFGSNPATSFNVVSSTDITAVTPPGSGAVTVSVTTQYGTGDSSGQYTYVPLPTIASNGLSPTAGPVAGGQTVTITGTNLSGTSAVTFGSAAATSVTVVSASEVTCKTPAGGAGSVSVNLTTVGGTATAPSQYTYVAAPTISSNGLSPAVGPTAGGTPVTITGTNLAGTSSVTFGGAAATNVTVVSPTEVTATSPAGAGAVTVTLTTAGGTATSPTPFTYYPQPSGLAISPFIGSAGGGTTVTITGAGLSGAEQVQFGSTEAASYTVVSPTEITAVAPAGAGSVGITVATPGGTATATPEFTYVPGPSVTAIGPAQGPQSGGTAVIVTGTSLAGVTSVDFGSTVAGFTDVTATSLVAFAPAGSGTVSIVVTTPGGTATASSKFTYLAAATVTGVSPADGPTAGGNVVTVTGTGLSGATAVEFGSTAGTITSTTATTVTVTVPAGTGTVGVVVVTPAGVVVSPADYNYLAAPTISGFTPGSGPTTGGTSVTISGTNLGDVTAVDFGSTAATFGFVTSTSLVAVAPAGSGSVDVSLTTPGGTATSAIAFTWFALPSITGISPADGPAAGGTAVTITGTGLGGATAVTFGSTAGTISAATTTSVTVVAPAGSGTVDVSLASPDGTALSPEQFTYVARPTITKLSPTTGPPAGGITITITGTALSDATAVHFGKVAAKILSAAATSVTVTLPKGSGTVAVSVTTPGGTSASVTADKFTYTAAPILTAMTPTSGIPTGGSVVEVIGTNLCNTTAVNFGGLAGTGATANATCTTLTVTTPAWRGGTPDVPHPVSVQVATPSGAANSPVDFTYIMPGYWMAGSDGAIYAFGGARYYGSMGASHLNEPIVAMADTPDHEGYWLFASDGGVFAFGDAKFYGSVPDALGPGHQLNAPIVAVEATPDGRGYRMFAADGGVFDFGDARYVGSLPGLHVKPNKPIVAATSDPVGQGYWLVGADGGVYTFPDAKYKGSLGSDRLSTSIVWMTNTVTGDGYWIFGANGSVWAMGDAQGYGAPGAVTAPICAGVATTTDAGYWLLGQDGAVYGYGDAPDLGSLPASHVSVDDIVGGIGF